MRFGVEFYLFVFFPFMLLKANSSFMSYLSSSCLILSLLSWLTALVLSLGFFISSSPPHNFFLNTSHYLIFVFNWGAIINFSFYKQEQIQQSVMVSLVSMPRFFSCKSLFHNYLGTRFYFRSLPSSSTMSHLNSMVSLFCSLSSTFNQGALFLFNLFL